MANVAYKDDTHQYFIDGVEVPSVSKLVSFACGDTYANVPQEILKRAGEYGSAVHNAIEKYVTTGEVEQFFETQVEAYKQLSEDIGLEVGSMEQIITDGKNFCGRYDILSTDGIIVDIKTNSQSKQFLGLDGKWSWQTSFYYYGLGVEKEYAYIIHIPKKGKPKLHKVLCHTNEECQMIIEMYKESLNAEQENTNTSN